MLLSSVRQSRTLRLLKQKRFCDCHLFRKAHGIPHDGGTVHGLRERSLHCVHRAGIACHSGLRVEPLHSNQDGTPRLAVSTFLRWENGWTLDIHT